MYVFPVPVRIFLEPSRSLGRRTSILRLPRGPQRIHPVHLMCFHDAGELHSLQLMGKYAQTTAMYSLYSLNSGRRWSPSPMNHRRCAACTCVLVFLLKEHYMFVLKQRNEYTSTCGTSPVIHRRWSPPASRKRNEYTSTCGASPVFQRRWSPPASIINEYRECVQLPCAHLRSMS